LIVLFAGLLIDSGYSSLFVPLGFPEDINLAPYTFFSVDHFREKFNFLFLICPVTVFAVPVVILRWRSFRKPNDPSFIFVIWTLTGCALFSLAVNPLLGIRDWDLLFIFGIPAALFSGWGLILALKGSSRRNGFLAAVALAAAVHGASWVWVNSDVNRGVNFLDRVRLEDFHTGTGKLNLGSLLQEKGFLPQAIRQYQLATGEKAQNTAVYHIGYCYLCMMMPDSTIHYYRSLYGTRWDTRHARELLMRLALAGFFDSYKKRLTENNTDIGALLFYLRYYTITQDEEKLARVYDHILKQDFPLRHWERLLEFALKSIEEESFSPSYRLISTRWLSAG